MPPIPIVLYKNWLIGRPLMGWKHDQPTNVCLNHCSWLFPHFSFKVLFFIPISVGYPLG